MADITKYEQDPLPMQQRGIAASLACQFTPAASDFGAI
jgi:hypothetical protein